MCLAVIAYEFISDWPLVIVANRDEFHDRPAAPMQVWKDRPHILAGRDMRAGGTWFGMNSRGAIALLTNVREPGRTNPIAPSRGKLVESYLNDMMSAEDYAHHVASSDEDFNGFNLLLVDELQGYVISNRASQHLTPITPGVHGLSNASLNTPWPKLIRSTQAVKHHLLDSPMPDADKMISIMRDDRPADDHEIPHTGLSMERERMLSSPFILSEDYGTRCTTVLMRHRSGKTWVTEVRYKSDGSVDGRSMWHRTPNCEFLEWSASDAFQNLNFDTNN